MTSVWVIVGWFGDQEWFEEIHTTEDGADRRCEDLWRVRTSEKTPEHARGVAKFAVEEWELVSP